MRFRAPRSVSPSPIRGKSRSTSTFGIQSDSESEDYNSELESSFENSSDDDDLYDASVSSSGGSSFELAADIGKLSIRPRNIIRTPTEQRQIDETVAAIRLRAHYTDPYEEWEKETRKDAFQTARKEFAESQAQLRKIVQEKDAQMVKDQADRYAKLELDSRKNLEKDSTLLRDCEAKMQLQLKERNDALWKRIEAAIKLEEERVAARLEAERKSKAEEEQRQKEAELKKRLEAEKLLREETARKKAAEEKKRAEEEKERQEKEELTKQKKLEDEQKRREEEEVELRQKLNMSSQKDDWRVARTDLFNIKSGPMRHVKGNKELRAEWGKLRRQIVPKVGQLTNDPESISRISQQIIEIVRPASRPHDEPAETEVVAEKRSAIPLAQVAFTLLETLEHFPTIFFAKLIQRCGGWVIPIVVPMHDVDEFPWNSPEDRIKASGVRRSTLGEGLETTDEYSNRISAVMRVYFHILKIRPTTPLHHMFQLPRIWTWFARMTGDYRLLQDPVAPQLLYTGLDVLGHLALEVWGHQWVKMLALIHEGITEGYEKGKLIGGNTTEGAAARTRTMVALENIVNGVQS